MGHNLLRDHMAFVGDTPWHGLGEQVPPNISGPEMLKAAGLGWEVRKIPAIGAKFVRRKNGQDVFDRYFVVRDRLAGETVEPVLGLVSPAYELLQNREAIAFFEPFISAGNARFETAGALGNGERIWAQVALGEPIEVSPGDNVNKYILLSNSHDGRGAVTVRFTPIRVVCQNTLNLATKSGEQTINVRHSRNVRDRLADHQVELLLRLVSETFKAAADQFRLLAKTKATAERRQSFLEKVLREGAATLSEIKLAKWSHAIDEVLDNAGVTPPASRHTMWGLYNAVTRTEDYRETRDGTAESRLDRVWFGRGASLKIKALHAAVELSGH